MKMIVTRTRQKILSITVKDGQLLVTANCKLTDEEIKNLVESRKDWISRQLPPRVVATTSDNNVEAQSQASDIADMFVGKKVMLGGELFDVLPTQENKCFVNGSKVLVPQKYATSKAERLRILKSFIKKISWQTTAEAVSHFGSCVSLCPTKIDFKNIANGWQKCCSPSDKTVVLDFRISQLPEELQHYVIVHCFAHFTQVGHDEKFWNTVCNYMPNYKQCIEALQKYNFLKEIV